MTVPFSYFSDHHQADLDIEATVTRDCIGDDCGWFCDDISATLAGEPVELPPDELNECYQKAQMAAA